MRDGDPPPPFHTFNAAIRASRPSISCSKQTDVSEERKIRRKETYKMVSRLIEEENLLGVTGKRSARRQERGEEMRVRGGVAAIE